MPDNRLIQMNQWLDSLKSRWGLQPASLAPASADASFRRYFRISSSHPQYPSLIVMDAPPDKETVLPFYSGRQSHERSWTPCTPCS